MLLQPAVNFNRFKPPKTPYLHHIRRKEFEPSRAEPSEAKPILCLERLNPNMVNSSLFPGRLKNPRFQLSAKAKIRKSHSMVKILTLVKLSPSAAPPNKTPTRPQPLVPPPPYLSLNAISILLSNGVAEENCLDFLCRLSLGRYLAKPELQTTVKILWRFHIIIYNSLF